MKGWSQFEITLQHLYIYLLMIFVTGGLFPCIEFCSYSIKIHYAFRGHSVSRNPRYRAECPRLTTCAVPAGVYVDFYLVIRKMHSKLYE